MNTIDKIREIKQTLDVDVLEFTVSYAGMGSENIDKYGIRSVLEKIPVGHRYKLLRDVK